MVCNVNRLHSRGIKGSLRQKYIADAVQRIRTSEHNPIFPISMCSVNLIGSLYYKHYTYRKVQSVRLSHSDREWTQVLPYCDRFGFERNNLQSFNCTHRRQGPVVEPAILKGDNMYLKGRISCNGQNRAGCVAGRLAFMWQAEELVWLIQSVREQPLLYELSLHASYHNYWLPRVTFHFQYIFVLETAQIQSLMHLRVTFFLQ